jgi:hypothetical protein
MNQVSLFCLLIMFLLLSTPSHAQISLSIPEALERAIKKNEPAWSLTSVMVTKNKEEDYTYFRWRREKQEIGVHVNEYVDNAQISPNSLLTAAPRERTLLEGIGDEAYLISSSPYNKTPRFDVVFRKGKVLITIEADSADIARRFAQHLADALPPPNNSLNRSAR